MTHCVLFSISAHSNGIMFQIMKHIYYNTKQFINEPKDVL